jgi:HSP20 family molecular chaperone IbpA
MDAPNGPEEVAMASPETGRDETITLIEPGPDGAQRIPVNVFETHDALVIVAPMPGVTADDVDIVVEADQLTMRAQLRAPASTRHYVMHEWEYGDYERTIPLPRIFHGDITASLGNGQLAISIARDGTRPTGARAVVRPS